MPTIAIDYTAAVRQSAGIGRIVRGQVDALVALNRVQYRNLDLRLFVAGPIAATVAAGLAADLLRLAGDPAVQQATATSIVLAVVSAILSVAIALVGVYWTITRTIGS